MVTEPNKLVYYCDKLSLLIETTESFFIITIREGEEEVVVGKKDEERESKQC